jgi:ankyrin repeat protein
MDYRATIVGAALIATALVALPRQAAAADKVHLAYVTALGSRHAHPGLNAPPLLPLTVEFGHNDTRVVVSREGGAVEAWDVLGGVMERSYDGERLIGYACHADTLLMLTRDDSIQLVGLQDDAHMTTASGSYVGSIAENCSTVVMQPAEGSIEIWDLGTLVARRTVSAPRTFHSAPALSPDGRYVAVVHEIPHEDDHEAADEGPRDATHEHQHRFAIDVWSIERDELSVRIDSGAPDVPMGVWRVLFSPDGKRIAADTRQDGKSGFRVWDAATGEELLRREDSPGYWTRALAWSSDGRFIASGGEDGEIALWSATTGEELDRLHARQHVQSLGFDDDGSRLAVGLWDSSVEIWAVEEGAGTDDIYDAVTREDVAAMSALLDANPALANARANGRPAPLFYAALTHNTELVKLLLDSGATPSDDPSPVSMAMTHPWLGGTYDVARMLLAAGGTADLHAAVQLGLVERVAEILRDDPAQARRTDWGLAPVDLAAEVGLVSVGMLFVEAGSEVNVFAAASFGLLDRVVAFLEDDPSLVHAHREQGGYTPLHCAAETGHAEVARFLLEHGADVHERNWWGFRPLHLATLSARGAPSTPGHVEIAQMLLDVGADPHVLDDYDRTPLTFVKDSENAGIRRLFAPYMQDD